MTASTASDEAQVLALLHEQNTALVAADTVSLDMILSPRFVAVHITGQEQTRIDWLAQIEAGRMRYHSIREESVSVTVAGDQAQVLSRALVDATIWGSRATWPLESSTQYSRVDGVWRPVRSAATTY